MRAHALVHGHHTHTQTYTHTHTYTHSHTHTNTHIHTHTHIHAQRLAKSHDEQVSLSEGLRKSRADGAAMDNTLTHVQQELAATKLRLSVTEQELSDRCAAYAVVAGLF